MTDLHSHLAEVGLEQYAERFIEEGFESWETVLHITESDLDHLKVKLGHRRALQREIAKARGITVEQLSNLNSAARTQDEDAKSHGAPDGVVTDGHLGTANKGKRKYRRHPKQDDQAPERPPSAYVLFSNHLREELKPNNLSFAAIAKRVGEQWQALSPDAKAPFESQAAAQKDEYHKLMDAYKKTDSYREYQEYLIEFKKKNPGIVGLPKENARQALSERRTDSKRARLELESNDGYTSMNSDHDNIDARSGSYGQAKERLDSTGQPTGYPSSSALSSPGSASGGPLRIAAAPHTAVSGYSPSSLSPSSPMLRRGSSNSSRPPSLLQPRPYVEPSADPTGSSSTNQRYPREPPYSRSGSSNSNLGGRINRGHESPAGPPSSSSARTPSLLHQPASSSSNISSVSQLSSVSTAPSSLYPTRSFEDDRPQLPPLSATGFRPTGKPNLADYSLQKSQTPESSMNPSGTRQHPPPSQFYPPPPSSEHLPRTSMRNLSLQPMQADGPQPHPFGLPRDLPHPSHSSSQPLLPSMRSSPSPPQTNPPQAQEGDRLALLADAAYADRDSIHQASP